MPDVAKPKRPDPAKNLLIYGDCLDVLGDWVPEESVDLIYLDPPFNSQRSYNVLFGQHESGTPSAQITAFDDTWEWGPDDQVVYERLLSGDGNIAEVIEGMRQILGSSDMMSYVVMMTERLIVLRRVLRPTGSLYLHCDPVASHYLKLILDAIFGPTMFRNEIIWQRTNSRTVKGWWPRIHDVILNYTKSASYHFEAPKVPARVDKMPHTLITGPDGQKYQTYELTAAEVRPPHTDAGSAWRDWNPTDMGRHWANDHATLNRWADEGLIHFPKRGGFPRRRAAEPFNPADRMVAVGDVWTDIDRINQSAKERLRYPTQKPLALLDRIIASSSKPGDVVLDPFCGCGTAVDAAQRLGRRWIGVDISYLAVDLIKTRMIDAHGTAIEDTFEVLGVPRDIEGARALHKRSPFDFERWAVSLIDGTPNEKQVGDEGSDGVVSFPLDGTRKRGKVIVSVKGGAKVLPDDVRGLGTAIRNHGGQMGVLIMTESPSKGVVEEVNRALPWTHPLTGQVYPQVQVITIPELLAGKRPNMPAPFMPYIQAEKFVPEHPRLPGLG